MQHRPEHAVADAVVVLDELRGRQFDGDDTAGPERAPELRALVFVEPGAVARPANPQISRARVHGGQRGGEAATRRHEADALPRPIDSKRQPIGRNHKTWAR